MMLFSISYDLFLTGPSSNSNPVTTKILYFTNRSVTPFMSTMSKKIGEITLRDFKVLFDRPGFYRFHFKSVDQEFGMVKEEVCFYSIIFWPRLFWRVFISFLDFFRWHGFARSWWQNCSMGRRRLNTLLNSPFFHNFFHLEKWHYQDEMVHNINYIL